MWIYGTVSMLWSKYCIVMGGVINIGKTVQIANDAVIGP